MQKFGMPMSKSKDILPDSNPWWKYNFDIQVKGQGHTEFMKLCDTTWQILPWWYTHVPNKVWLCQRTKRGLNTKPICHKPYKFDLEVKGQCRIRIMNVLDTYTHVPSMVCQCLSKQKLQVWHEDMTKALEVKGQHRFLDWLSAKWQLMNKTVSLLINTCINTCIKMKQFQHILMIHA